MSLKGKESSTVEYPQWYEDLMRGTASLGAQSAAVGPMQWQGPSVAAISPREQQARGNLGQMLAGFGLNGGGGSYLPAPTQFAGGVRGYSGYPAVQEAFGKLPDWQRELYNGLWGPNGAFMAMASGAFGGGGGFGGGPGGDVPRGPVNPDAGGGLGGYGEGNDDAVGYNGGSNNYGGFGDGFSDGRDFDPTFGGNVGIGGYAP